MQGIETGQTGWLEVSQDILSHGPIQMVELIWPYRKYGVPSKEGNFA